jgi:hypothetical protein
MRVDEATPVLTNERPWDDRTTRGDAQVMGKESALENVAVGRAGAPYDFRSGAPRTS